MKKISRIMVFFNDGTFEEVTMPAPRIAVEKEKVAVKEDFRIPATQPVPHTTWPEAPYRGYDIKD